MYNSSLLVNKELGYLILSKEWPTVYESQLNKKNSLVRKKNNKKERKEIAKKWQNKRKQKETKLDTNSLNFKIYACDVFVLGSAWISKLLGVHQHSVTWVN